MPAAERDRCRPLTQDCFVARQPILDGSRQLYGYELLFRSGNIGHATHSDGDEASLHVIGNALSVFGLDTLTAGKMAFVNFTRDLLLGDHARLLPPGRTVVEVLETVEPQPDVLEACRGLKRAGYLIALDDYVGDPAGEPFVGLADVVKVDFRASTPDQRRALAGRLIPRGIKLLAEKVETWEEQREAAALGYRYFQGYFFCRPETLCRRALAPSRVGYLRLLE
ncbi:MAG TPA: EAL domain-containing protein, partial [Gemmataceae bacterium]|nr:EAL domain-containing protein [Gemmataceae bacterium]